MYIKLTKKHQDTGDLLIGRPAVVGGGGTSKSTGGMNGAGMSSSATQHIAADPTEAEEEVMKGRITFAMTAHKEVGFLFCFFSCGL